MTIKQLDLETHQMQSNLQFNMLNRLKTGNIITDSIITIIIGTFVTVLFSNIQTLLNFSNWSYFVNRFYSKIKSWYYYYLYHETKIITKTVTIDYLTENKKINNLYKSVDWYLSTKLDNNLNEPHMIFSYEDDITEYTDLDKLIINKRITNDKYKKIIFNDHQISYILSKNLISVYTDKERKKENHTITLETKVTNDKVNILDEFCSYCLTEYTNSKKRNKWEQKIFVNNVEGKWNSQKSNNRRKIDTVILKNNMIQKIKSDIDDFINSEDWYFDRDIPYTLGYLFYGEPGTGKTSTIKAISNYTKRDIHYLMLNNIKDDNQLLDLLREIKFDTTILVIEDVDCMTKIIKTRKEESVNEELQKRLDELENKMDKDYLQKRKQSSQLTLSGLLNALDGVFNSDGRIMIMTTNHPQVLDKALIRPGRIDRRIHFDYCNIEQIKDIYKMMYCQECNTDLDNKLNNKYSPAEITSLFLKYKNNPEEAMLNIDNIDEENIVYEKKKFNSNIYLS